MGTITSNKNEVKNAKELPETGEKKDKASTTLMGLMLIVFGDTFISSNKEKTIEVTS
ncbi:LPXTG cell wall anchor domain-containing protein [Brochothrix thermosphacta]|uniref:LPXTG cell wall anchor domain-containing protein n=1 Tax=Brochothrix thermosphacta TaxID=2756 RepID=UPI00128B38C6|nr:LPXTG cell wall anchor domain-containing protein [Brochothrix thermosphacta]